MLDLSKERVLVTGGGGFLGRHVCKVLRERGADVCAPTRSEFDAATGEIGYCSELMRRIEPPSVVIHLAATCGGIGANQNAPARMIADNLAMALNVVDECRRVGAKLVAVGSVCSYPENCPVPFKESDLWNGYPESTNAPYGIAKRTLFELAAAYHKQHGLKCACLLPANLYGPGDHFDLENSHVIPAMIRKFVEAKEAGAESVTLWGTGKPARDFLYVEDAAEAIVRAAERIDTPEPVNLGTGVETSIGAAATTVETLITGNGCRIEWDSSRPDGQMRRCLDTSKASSLLDWNATTELWSGVYSTYEWYLANRKERANAIG